ncbi:branched-chain alpha-keto acid dehydrogenase E2 component [Collimonas sp. OK307]|uniref:dihydrolipoamide acetyltransferase family protein n=1 Tax=Collimonas sp. OK307 TaxID=1801620 RepID=UPI0008E5AF60|nr:dihydrolipoamide acetyltransferase family protein [Collimonas sp. OK307]SFI11286.1 branched-chain alpha-keto acid dehydrogenase E2 component [Collimonas sp. OK307]
MSIHVIKMPDIGEGIAEVELVAWRVQVGERVVEDQILADVMTDKATVEIPSPVVGKVVALGCEPGQVVAVGGELIRLEVEQAEHAGAALTTPAAVSQATVTQMPTPVATSPKEAPAAKVPVQGIGSVQAMRQATDAPTASPAVRRRAHQLGITLQDVPASGIDGRITHEDLDVYVTHATGGSSAPAASIGGGSHAERYAERHGEEAIPVIGLRRKIAQKMQESKRRIPHFTYVEECDVTEIEALRAHLNARWGGERGRLTLLPLLMRAMVLALRAYPQCNARFDDEAGVVTRYGAVHIGIATQTAAGLMVPVVHHAEARDLWSNAAEITRLAEAARAGRAVRAELSGSTITITSLGALGGLVSTPVINHPEVAIVGVNRIIERPVIRDNVVVARKMMNLSSSFDHRVVDGLDAAEFVQSLRGYLESPATLFVE